MTRSLLFIVFFFTAACSFSQSSLSAKDAAKHIGEKATVCDKVFGGPLF